MVPKYTLFLLFAVSYLQISHIHNFVSNWMLNPIFFFIGRNHQCSSLTLSPRLRSSSPDSLVSRSTEFPWLTAWSQTLLHTQEGQGQAPGAGEEKPLCYQGSDAAGPHTPVTPGHPNVASFCAHAQGCTTKPAETKSTDMQTSSHIYLMCTTEDWAPKFIKSSIPKTNY